jgi:hypothetical protein
MVRRASTAVQDPSPVAAPSIPPPPPRKPRKAASAAADDGDWLQRRNVLRAVEWEMHTALLEAGRQSLAAWLAKPGDASPAEIARFITLGSELGRLSSGLPLSHSEVQSAPAPAIRVEVEAALNRAYGPPPPPAGGDS